jgi:hypothetical protein
VTHSTVDKSKFKSLDIGFVWEAAMITIFLSGAAIVVLATSAQAATSSASFGVGITIVAEACGPGLARGAHGRCQAVVHPAACAPTSPLALDHRRC